MEIFFSLLWYNFATDTAHACEVILTTYTCFGVAWARWSIVPQASGLLWMIQIAFGISCLANSPVRILSPNSCLRFAHSAFGKDSLYMGKLAGKYSTLAGTEMLVTKFTKIACCTFRDRQHMNFLIAGRNLVTVWFSRLRSVNNYSLWVWFKSLRFPNTKTMCRLCALFFCILMLYCTSLSEVKGLGTSSHPHSIY